VLNDNCCGPTEFPTLHSTEFLGPFSEERSSGPSVNLVTLITAAALKLGSGRTNERPIEAYSHVVEAGGNAVGSSSSQRIVIVTVSLSFPSKHIGLTPIG